MGLLDTLNSDEGMQALGLLAAAGPSATPASFGQRLFGAMQADQARRSEAEDRKMRQQMQRLQMEQLLRQASRQKSIEDLPGQFMQPGMKPDTMDNRDVGQPGEAPIPKQQFDLSGYADALFRYDPHTALQLKASLQKDNKPIPVAKDTVLLDPTTRQPIFSNVQPDHSPLAKLMAEMNALPPSSPLRKVYQDAINKATTHQPATNVAVQYGAPMSGTDSATGNPVFFAPNKDPNKPPVIIGGVTPPKKDKPVEFTKSVAGLNELENGLASYEKTLRENKGVSPMSTGEQRANLQASYTSLQMGLKNAFELGALAGPDLALLQGMLIDPTSPKAIFVGDKGVAAQINKAREYLKNRKSAVYKAHGETPPADAPQTPNVVNFSDLK